MSDTSNTQSPRRKFLQQSLWLLAAFPLLGHVLTACTKNSGGGSPLPAGEVAVKENDPVAAALGYKESATQVDTAKYAKRKGPEGEKQFCHNCQFYTPKGESGWGKCQIIPSGLVKSEGWCNTWAAKPATS